MMTGMADSVPPSEQNLGSPGDGNQVRKPYQSPELVEWGSVVELTKGSTPIGSDDPDFVSTSFGT
jgi:hypothetical protein